MNHSAVFKDLEPTSGFQSYDQKSMEGSALKFLFLPVGRCSLASLHLGSSLAAEGLQPCLGGRWEPLLVATSLSSELQTILPTIGSQVL